MTDRSFAGLAAAGRGLGDLGAVRVIAVAVIMFLAFAATAWAAWRLFPSRSPASA